MSRISFLSIFSSKLGPKIKNSIYISNVISLALLILTLITLIRVQPEVPIFYSLALPSQQLAQKYWLLLFPTISIVISVLHLLIIKTMNHLDELVLELFAWVTVAIQVLLSLSLLRIIIIIS